VHLAEDWAANAQTMGGLNVFVELWEGSGTVEQLSGEGKGGSSAPLNDNESSAFSLPNLSTTPTEPFAP
jgi:hypothetical protein